MRFVASATVCSLTVTLLLLLGWRFGTCLGLTLSR